MGTNLVIFDMDGLLFDTERPSFQALQEVVVKRGYPFTLDHYKQLIGIPDRESDVVLLKMYGDDFPFDVISEEYHERFKRILVDEGISVKPGVVELLTALEERGIKKCIASSSTRETIAGYLKRTGLEGRFDFYISGNDIKKGKPHPDIFVVACKLAGEPAESALVLEDSLNGLKAACAAGIRCVMVPDLIDPTEEMREKAYKIVSDLGEVVGLLDIF
ncbi:HAD family phosphatase [Neobacillus sp. DY30]|uniref:HAD family hydrolase n=1 Tax=Neobacillus sp. DY30 TaxID=3047871 RepID=UPI0024BF8852|nr:HAD family phosphatase [Neobacillus sp. DY30]WHY00550.1 HAD family phosphatase [Neobacillus sp. DY30]